MYTSVFSDKKCFLMTHLAITSLYYTKYVSEHDQKISQSNTPDQPTTPWGRVTEDL